MGPLLRDKCQRGQTAAQSGTEEHQTRAPASRGVSKHSCLKECVRHKTRHLALAPQVKRKDVRVMINGYHFSERHACAIVRLSRDSYRHKCQTSALNAKLREQIVQTAHTRRGWGTTSSIMYCARSFPNTYHKGAYRIYTAQGLSIRKRKKTKRIVLACACRWWSR